MDNIINLIEKDFSFLVESGFAVNKTTSSDFKSVQYRNKNNVITVYYDIKNSEINVNIGVANADNKTQVILIVLDYLKLPRESFYFSMWRKGYFIDCTNSRTISEYARLLKKNLSQIISFLNQEGETGIEKIENYRKEKYKIKG